jgi:hypothetical protein
MITSASKYNLRYFLKGATESGRIGPVFRVSPTPAFCYEKGVRVSRNEGIEMTGRPLIGGRPLTNVERQRRWRAAHPSPSRRRETTVAIIASQPAGVRAVPDARLRNLEYDVLLRRAFYTEQAPLAAWLHRIADRMVAGVRAFADEHGATVAGELLQPAKAVRALLSEYLEMQIDEFGDLHAEIEKALKGPPARDRYGRSYVKLALANSS